VIRGAEAARIASRCAEAGCQLRRGTGASLRLDVFCSLLADDGPRSRIAPTTLPPRERRSIVLQYRKRPGTHPGNEHSCRTCTCLRWRLVLLALTQEGSEVEGRPFSPAVLIYSLGANARRDPRGKASPCKAGKARRTNLASSAERDASSRTSAILSLGSIALNLFSMEAIRCFSDTVSPPAFSQPYRLSGTRVKITKVLSSRRRGSAMKAVCVRHSPNGAKAPGGSFLVPFEPG
jgi:hypothetical protein